MLDPNLLRTEPDAVAEKLARRGFKLDVDKLRALEERRKVLQVQTENLQAGVTPDRNPLARRKRAGKTSSHYARKLTSLANNWMLQNPRLETLLAEIRDIALAIPNIPHDDVPVGRDENDNVEVSRWGTPRQFDFEVRDHVTLGEMHGGLDFAAAVKLTGSRFVVMKGAAGPSAPRPGAVHAGSAHRTAWLQRKLCPVPGKPGHPVWHWPAAEIRRRPVPYPSAGRRG